MASPRLAARPIASAFAPASPIAFDCRLSSCSPRLAASPSASARAPSLPTAQLWRSSVSSATSAFTASASDLAPAAPIGFDPRLTVSVTAVGAASASASAAAPAAPISLFARLSVTSTACDATAAASASAPASPIELRRRLSERSALSPPDGAPISAASAAAPESPIAAWASVSRLMLPCARSAPASCTAPASPSSRFHRCSESQWSIANAHDAPPPPCVATLSLQWWCGGGVGSCVSSTRTACCAPGIGRFFCSSLRLAFVAASADERSARTLSARMNSESPPCTRAGSSQHSVPRARSSVFEL